MSEITATAKERRSFTDLSLAVFGRRLGPADAFEFLMRDEFTPEEPRAPGAVWLGSIGYEGYRESSALAEKLRTAGVERLIDVRELPISRRKGYAKTALGETMLQVGIEYVHLRALGNPKPYRDLYKSGRVDEGRAHYKRFLCEEREDALRELEPLLREKRSALMCVESDPSVCHRTVIIDALRGMGVDLAVEDLS